MHERNEKEQRPDLLFLCHRFPYPPDRGDKIRSYHWLLALTECFRVHLAAFMDAAAAQEHQERLESMCASCLFLPLQPALRRARSLAALLTGEALRLPYYRDRRLHRWLGWVWRSHDIARLFVYSSAMAQYVAGPPFERARRVIDFVDPDSGKWRRSPETVPRPTRWVYRREAKRLASFDLSIVRAFDVSLFVSPAEAAPYRNRLGDGERVMHLSNGVDSAYFDPGRGYPSPYPEGVRAVVFIGAMDQWANLDAVVWFTREAWPFVRVQDPHAVFFIVGAQPAPAVRALADDGVVVTGRVPDVRPFLEHADVVVAPMRIARGARNKVLEGMSMARPVVVTGDGLEGISAEDGREVLVADDAEQFAQCILQTLKQGAQGLGIAARQFVRREHSWDKSCRRLVQLVKG